ncbi:hypothetical protein [Egicoccus halophilus]|uniref:Uncharacterized protein n=1 Tax=Egicoccus halophilus TaxID=1670830 RepID=A0A8J3A6K4_9ACTN|nr:hypothetical protein [Egicoccus halophilus]GGI04611.1 hypothetical protein GCM10011354_09960 [Egicoccus halophilus]
MTATATSTPGGLDTALRVASWLVPLGILLQAALAGQALFVDGGLFGLHGGVGHGVLGLAVVQAGLVLVRRAGALPLGLAVVLVIGLVGQTGLGYVGHRTGNAVASSLHVPLGVTLLGLSVALAVLLGLRRQP